MNEILAVVAFLVLVGLLVSRMERNQRECKIQDDSYTEVEPNNLLGAVARNTPELRETVQGSLSSSGSIMTLTRIR